MHSMYKTGFIQSCYSVEFVKEGYKDRAGKIHWGQILNALPAFQTKAIHSFHKLLCPFMRPETQLGISLVLYSNQCGWGWGVPENLGGSLRKKA